MEKRMIIEGEKIQHVGYRPFLLTEVLRHKEITNFQADNVRENGKKKNGKTQKVIISMVGEEQNISDFAEFIKNNFPDYAKNCKVILEEDKCQSKVMTINDFRDALAVEQQSTMVQAGLELKEGVIVLGEKIDTGFNKMNENFKGLDAKYKLISEGMFAVVNELKEANKTLREENKTLGDRLEKSEKNIERLLEILEKRTR